MCAEFAGNCSSPFVQPSRRRLALQQMKLRRPATRVPRLRTDPRTPAQRRFPKEALPPWTDRQEVRQMRPVHSETLAHIDVRPHVWLHSCHTSETQVDTRWRSSTI